MSMKTRDEKEKKRDLFTTIFWILVLVFLIVKIVIPETGVLGMVNDGVANPPGTVIFKAESKGEFTSVSVEPGILGGRMALVELPLPKNCGDKIVLSMDLVIGQKRRPARFAAQVRSGQAPYELTICLKH